MNEGGEVAVEFNVLDVMKEYHWTYQEYQLRPVWFDSYYAIKLKAEAKYREIKNNEK
jgi:hypothetical protein